MTTSICVAGVWIFNPIIMTPDFIAAPGTNSGTDSLPSFELMPVQSPVSPPGPYRFVDREYLIITYETDIEAVKAVVPAPLEVPDPLVRFEFINMPDSSGFGSYTEAGQVIPVIYQGMPGLYILSMYLDDEAPIAAGREIWGFPKKLARPSLYGDPISKDTLVGRLFYGEIEVARGTMGYKWQSLNTTDIRRSLEEIPNYLLKVIPDVDGKPAIKQLIRYYLTEVQVKGAWTGPADIELFHHALAPVAGLPVKWIVSSVHFISDLTLPYGEVVHDYLK
jgi:acetoacetate decarboxylase